MPAELVFSIVNTVMLIALIYYIVRVNMALRIFSRVLELSGFVARLEEYEKVRAAAAEHLYRSESQEEETP
jgi:hypothetical protein